MSDEGQPVFISDLGAAHAGFQLSTRLLAVFVDNQLLSVPEVCEILQELVQVNRGGGPANEVAAQLFGQMLAQYQKKR